VLQLLLTSEEYTWVLCPLRNSGQPKTVKSLSIPDQSQLKTQLLEMSLPEHEIRLHAILVRRTLYVYLLSFSKDSHFRIITEGSRKHIRHTCLHRRVQTFKKPSYAVTAGSTFNNKVTITVCEILCTTAASLVPRTTS